MAVEQATPLSGSCVPEAPICQLSPPFVVWTIAPSWPTAAHVVGDEQEIPESRLVVALSGLVQSAPPSRVTRIVIGCPTRTHVFAVGHASVVSLFDVPGSASFQVVPSKIRMVPIWLRARQRLSLGQLMATTVAMKFEVETLSREIVEDLQPSWVSTIVPSTNPA
jgi:hypothetical protein